jgi:Fe(3+) dicitrate transport protein
MSRLFSSAFFLILSLFCTSFFDARAQASKGTIKGRILTSDGKPAQHVGVGFKGTSYGAFTDENGFFLFKAPEGSYTLKTQLVGYASEEKEVTVQAGTTVTLEDLPMKESFEEVQEVVVTATRTKNGMGYLDETEGAIIYSGKKTEVITLDSIDANKAQNNPRQILGRIPGMNFSETEGSGFPSNGFGLRGLNPTQSIEMNARQNGYNISADIFGYNEAYYNPSMEGVQKVEVIRGASSLQFGPQFGGVVNFVLKDAPKDKKVECTMQQTIGSYGLFNSFLSVGGTVGKFSYYAYGQYKAQEGWRPNSGYTSGIGFAKMGYQATKRLKLGLEYSILRNRIQMPGGLTDEQFNEDPRASYRARNWLNSPWNILTGTVDYTLSENILVTFKSSYMVSQRNLVWRNEDGGPGTLDSISPVTLNYVPREVEHEYFNNSTNELRIRANYGLLGARHTLAGGVRYFYGTMHRQGGGEGTTGSDFDLTTTGDYGYDLNFSTTNLAPFLENTFHLGNRLSVTPGFRFEYINSTIKGYTSAGGEEGEEGGGIRISRDESRNRYVPLFGIGGQFKVTKSTNFYANWSQAYRPFDYSSLTPIGVTSKVDPHLKDASGYNADLGWRGNVKDFLNFDLGLFYMAYNDRVGIISSMDQNTGNVYTIRTNTGNSVNKGLESYVEINPLKALSMTSLGNISLFNSYSMINAEYTSGVVNGESIKGNKVEYAPSYIERFGATYSYRPFSVTYQISKVGKSFGDAQNTVLSPDATVGEIPSYQVMDLSATYKIKNFNIKAGVNNLANAQYFTKRTDEYPGPGIIPMPYGRSFYLSFGAKF